MDQAKADELLAMPKRLVKNSPVEFPIAGLVLTIEAMSEDGRESFLFDVNRKGKINLKKCTYNERYAVTEILLRVDVEGPTHTNPDGVEVPCPHLHTYREGYGDKWAEPLPALFTNPGDLVTTLREFLKYANVKHVPQIQRGIN